MSTPLVPPEFAVPTEFSGPGFRLEPLGPEHNDRDHHAWGSSIDHIRATPGFEESDWPHPMSRDDNLADLERHADDFAARRGFTYSILDEDEVIGCLYIYPPRLDGADAHVTSWVTKARSELDGVVRREISRWLDEAWPFQNPYYAGR